MEKKMKIKKSVEKDVNKAIDSLFKIKGVSEKGGDRILVGYAGTIVKDRVRDVITLEAWKKSEKDLLQPGANTVFFNHDTDKPVGKVVKTEVDDKGLIVTVKFSKANDVDDIWTKIKEGILNSMSIRLRVKRVERVEDPDTGSITEYRIKEMELFEVSVVGLPANPAASILEATGKSLQNKISNKEKHMATKTDKVPQPTPSGVSEEKAKTMVAEQIKPVADSVAAMKALVDTVAASQKQLADAITALSQKAKTAEELKQEADAAKAAAQKKFETENPVMAELVKSVAALTAQLGKKSEQSSEQPDPNKIKKVLKDASDPETVKYVLHLLGDGNALKGNPDEFAALSKEEQSKATSVYFGLLLASTTQK
jgi:HK97 family phage prohead protease